MNDNILIEIADLEKKYFKIIESIITSEEFKNSIRKSEKFIQKRYDFLSKHWLTKNKIKIAVERILRFFFYKRMDIINIYSSVLSSDIAFYTEDVLLNIDAKTTDMVGNPGDWNQPAQVQKDQITFKSSNMFKSKQNFPNPFWDYLMFKGLLEPWTINPNNKKKVPTLSFFIKFQYFDNPKLKTFKMGSYALTCVPHNDLSNRFDNNIFQGYKTYKYKGSNMVLTDEEIKKNKNWIYGKVKNRVTNSENEWYYDPENNNAWKKGKFGAVGDKKELWKSVKAPGNTRLKQENYFNKNSESIRKRIDSEGKRWIGYKEYSLHQKSLPRY